MKCATSIQFGKRQMGNRSKCENYRPISLLCNLSKVMEKFVHSQLHDYLFNNGLIYKRQSAYSPNDSTTCTLISLVHLIHENLDKGREVRSVFPDIFKAFDKCTLYKDDLHEAILSFPFMYADDVTLVEPVEDPVVSIMALNSDLAAISTWANQWLLHFNAAKCKSILFSVKSKKVYHSPLFFNKKIL